MAIDSPKQYPLQVRMLGPFEAKHMGVSIPRQAWGRTKSLSIAKFLLAHRGTAVSLGRLSELFYDSAPVDRIRSNIRGRISEIRRALFPDRDPSDPEAGVQLVAGSAYRLDPHAPMWIDVEWFEHCLEAANDAYRQEMWQLALEDFARARALYRGDFLADDLDEPWTLEIRERLRLSYQLALVSAAECHLRLGQYRSAAAAARRAQEIDPLDEEAYRIQIEAFGHLSDKVAALRVYEELKTALQELDEEPDPEITDLVQRIKRGGLKAGTPGPRHNLRQPLTAFFGREQELALVREHLTDAQTRIVTLLGPGGIGKTRLAMEAGRHMATEFRDGVFYVPASEYASAQSLAAGIAQTIGFSAARPRSGLDELADFLANKEMLLIIDAAEHARDLTPLLETLLQAPRVKLLVTSRTRLHFPGELIIEIEGLPYPEEPPGPLGRRPFAPEHTPAYRLFVDRYARLRPRFRPTDEDRGAISRVCRLVEGMPLAIEMAASWGRVLTCREIADRIASFEPLAETLEEREQGMQGVFSFSWQLLTEVSSRPPCACPSSRGAFRGPRPSMSPSARRPPSCP